MKNDKFIKAHQISLDISAVMFGLINLGNSLAVF